MPNQLMGWSSLSADSAMLDEAAVIQFGNGLAKLLLGVHHDGAIPSHGFFDRLAGYQQESDALAASLHHDLVSAVKEHQGVIADIVDGRGVRFRDLLGKNRSWV